jgi:hypothetical protein
MPPNPPSLPDLVRVLINHLEGIGDHLEFQSAKLTEIADGQREVLERLRSLDANIDGFTNSGASFGAYQVDQYTMAYLTLLGPLLSIKLSKELGARPISDVMKACAPLTRDALEEMGAYRQAQQGRDLLANAAGTTGNPWETTQPEPDSDWTSLN